MRWATGCCETHPWRPGTLAAALLMLFASGARAGDTNAAAAAPQYAAACTRAASFRTVVDVGHGTDAPGALSARGIDEYEFNLRLARMIEKELRGAGFDKTVLMVTSDKPPRGLFKRVARANGLKPDLFLSVHHDSVPDRMMETWQSTATRSTTTTASRAIRCSSPTTTPTAPAASPSPGSSASP